MASDFGPNVGLAWHTDLFALKTTEYEHKPAFGFHANLIKNVSSTRENFQFSNTPFSNSFSLLANWFFVLCDY